MMSSKVVWFVGSCQSDAKMLREHGLGAGVRLTECLQLEPSRRRSAFLVKAGFLCIVRIVPLFSFVGSTCCPQENQGHDSEIKKILNTYLAAVTDLCAKIRNYIKALVFRPEDQSVLPELRGLAAVGWPSIWSCEKRTEMPRWSSVTQASKFCSRYAHTA